MKIKLPRALRRRPKGLRFPNGIPRVPATDAELLRSTPLAVLGIADCDRYHLDEWTPAQPVRELGDHAGVEHDAAVYGQVYLRVPAASGTPLPTSDFDLDAAAADIGEKFDAMMREYGL